MEPRERHVLWILFLCLLIRSLICLLSLLLLFFWIQHAVDASNVERMAAGNGVTERACTRCDRFRFADHAVFSDGDDSVCYTLAWLGLGNGLFVVRFFIGLFPFFPFFSLFCVVLTVSLLPVVWFVFRFIASLDGGHGSC